MAEHLDGAQTADRVRAIWSDAVVGSSGGSPATDITFLAAGGHSLSAAKLLARLRSELGVKLSMTAVMQEDPTLDGLIGRVIDHQQNAADHATGHLTDQACAGGRDSAARDTAAEPSASAEGPQTADPGATTHPISPNMRRVWAWHRIHPHSPAYNVVRVLRIDGRIRPGPLRAALGDLVTRHEALRCAVVEPRPGAPEIILSDDVAAPLSTSVVRAEDGDLSEEVDAALRRITDQPFAMEAAPLWRVGVVWVPQEGCTYLGLVMHHLISDLRTTNIVLDEIAHAYHARQAAVAPSFAAPAPSLLAHLRYERDLHGGQRWREDLEWWSVQLSSAAPALPLPLSATERDESNNAAHTLTADISPAATASIDDTIRTRRCTPALYFLSAASLVLSAWTGHERPEVVGVPSLRAGRPEDQNLVGFLLDTLPLPLMSGSADSFMHHYGAVNEAYANAVDHALPPFDDILNRLRMPRGARSPLIRLWFSDMTRSSVPARFGDQTVAEHDLAPGWALFDLGIYLRRTATGYRIHLVSPDDLCARGDLLALLNQIVALARHAAIDPDRSIAELLLCNVPSGNAGRSIGTGPSGDTLPKAEATTCSTEQLVQINATEHPTKIAIVDSDGALAYAELDAAVNEVAATIDPSAVVAIPAYRDRQFITRLLATWRAHATAVLIDPEWPALRRRRAAQASGVTHDWTCEELLDGGPANRPAANATAGGQAKHILLTSGTSGDPFAVKVVTHVCDGALADLVDLLAIDQTDHMSMISSPGHDPALRDVGLALRVGATVHIPPPATVRNPVGLAAWVKDQRITVLSATPTVLAALFQGPHEFDHVRIVISGGAPLSTTVVGHIRSTATNSVIINGYGCTETPQIVAAHCISPDAVVPSTPQVTVGKPLPQRRCEVHTETGSRRDVGQLGEIWVAAPHIAAGYLPGAHPAQNETSPFVHDQAGTRWFRTGDLARQDADGNLHLAGRRDRQVSVNGNRVNLQEIEDLARATSGATDALAEVIGEGGAQAIRLWVQQSHSARIHSDAVRAGLAARLPEAMVPSTVSIVDRLEMNENLKPIQPPQVTTPLANEASPLEDQVLELAEAVLGGTVEPETNFFDAGFSSASLLHLGAELSAFLQRPIDALVLFQHPNVRSLGKSLAGDTHEGRPAQNATQRAERMAQMRDRRNRARQWIRERQGETG